MKGLEESEGKSRRVVGQPEARPAAVARAWDRHVDAEPIAICTTQAAALAPLEAWLAGVPAGALIIDAGCGTGASTEALADLHPRAHVLGVDKSSARLGPRAEGDLSGRLAWLRADLPALWQYLRERGVVARRSYLLYPNPWPKSAHIGRRWPAHPAWRDILATCSSLELRTNWSVYAEEFVAGLSVATGREASIERIDALLRRGDMDVLTPFERKYLRSDHALFRVRVQGEASAPLWSAPGLEAAARC